MTYLVGGGLGGVRYRIGMPNVSPGNLRVEIMGVLMMLECGNMKGICSIGFSSHWLLGSLFSASVIVVRVVFGSLLY